MRSRILKFVLETPTNHLVMPKGSKILAFQMQNGNRCIWVLCPVEADKTTRTLTIYGTGWVIRDSESIGTYVGTVQDGEFVWHIFDEGESG